MGVPSAPNVTSVGVLSLMAVWTTVHASVDIVMDVAFPVGLAADTSPFGYSTVVKVS